MNTFENTNLEKNKKYITPDIYIIDGFLPIEFIDTLNAKLLDSSWYMHHSSIRKYPNDFFWTSYLEGDEYSEEIKYFEQIFNYTNVLRIYANGQSSTQHGGFHYDDGNRTYLIGMSKDWNMESGGATEFVIDEANHITTSIYPLYNRLISFPSNVMHRALPNISLNKFRMTLAIKTADKRNNISEKKSLIEFI